MELTLVETRVLGCLLEKERTTPDTYPLTLNSLLLACNQTTNRDPSMTLNEREIEEALDGLRQKKLATVIFGGGSRVQKYRHLVPDLYNFSPQESALLCVLLLRGPQTLGELRGRTERMASFPQLSDVEGALAELAGGEEPLVRLLPQRPGQKERRYVQLLSGEPVEPSPEELVASASRERPRAVAAESAHDQTPRLEALERELADLRAQVGTLRESLDDLRRALGA